MRHIGLGLVLGMAVVAMTETPAASQTPGFEVASIKAATNDGPRNSSSYGPQAVTFRGVSLGFVIAEAYHFPGGRIVGPGSMTNEALWPSLARGYDIAAKAEHPVFKDQLRLMLQTSKSNPQGPAFIDALHEQLGLKLEPAKAAVQILRVDHVELPSEN